MENKQTLIGEVTADQINAWKEQHGEVFAIKVNGHVCYLRKPTRRELSFATTAGKNDPLKFNETLLRGCWLGGWGCAAGGVGIGWRGCMRRCCWWCLR